MDEFGGNECGGDDLRIGWGVIGCAEIARKNIRAIKLSRNAVLLGIASRDITKAERFATENDVNLNQVSLYGSYEELLLNQNISAVYIPLPTTMHLEWVIKAAQAGKHILLEKPVAVKESEYLLMNAACRENNVNLMDGTMFMHHKRFNLILRSLKDPFMGRVQQVRCSFSFNGDHEAFMKGNIRTSASGDPLGCLGDLGWYCIRFGIMAFSGLTMDDKLHSWKSFPQVVSARCFKYNEEGVPLEVEARIGFGDDNNKWSKSLIFDCSFLCPFRQRAEISVVGNDFLLDKVISLDDFVIPRNEKVASFTIESLPKMALSNNATVVLSNREVIDCSTDCPQEVNMFDSFASDLDRSSPFWDQISFVTQSLLDACMESIKSDGQFVLVTFGKK